MTTDVATVPENATVSEVVAALRQHRVRGLPVVDDRGDLVGIVTETDLFIKEKGVPFSMERTPSLLGEFLEPRELDRCERARDVTVEEVMTRRVRTVTEETTLRELAIVMFERRLNCLPVTRGRKLVGMVSRIDVLERIYAPGMAEPAVVA